MSTKLFVVCMVHFGTHRTGGEVRSAARRTVTSIRGTRWSGVGTCPRKGRKPKVPGRGTCLKSSSGL